ncbi:MAG: AMP-binding protein [Rhodobacteraceae bacterium]|nr:AMP-binding protein [Paracoccaceae bacterium]
MTHPWEKYYSEAAKKFDLADMGPQTLGELVDYAADTYGDSAKFTTILPTGAEGSITFREFRSHVESFAAYLREVVGLKAGDTVALMTPNCIGFTVASMGIVKAGCKLTNVNPLYTEPEMEHQLNDSQAKALVIIDLFGAKVDAVVPNTGVKHVVTLSIVDFFAPLKKMLLGFVLKRVRKVVPDITTPHVKFADALAQGARAAKGVDVAAYTADVKPTDTVLYQYTSGTTGRSKGAELHHQGILANAYQAELMTDHLRGGGGETTLIALPLYHITAFTLIFVAGLKTGGHALLVPSPRPPSNLQKALEKHKITWFTGINTLYAALLAEPWFKKEHWENLRFSGSGGAAQQTGVAQKWKDATGVDINQGYGMTEVHGVLTLNPPSDNRLGKVGIPVPGMQIKIVGDNGHEVELGEPGEVLAKGPTLMHGYFNRPDANEDSFTDGWLHSGDIGVMDADGFLEIVDRKKDMILVSGFNVAPAEIEDVISTVPGVVQVGVIGIPDEKTSETPAAFIVRKDDSVTEEMIMEACKSSLTNYKRPHKIEFVDEVPVTLSGKVLRRELRDKYLAS